MKTLLFAVVLALFSCILAGPIPEQSKGFFVTTVNKTAVEKEVVPEVPLVPVVTSKPLEEEPELATKIATIENEIVAKSDEISTSIPLDDEKLDARGEEAIKPVEVAKPEELKPEILIATESPPLEQRNDDSLPESSTERPIGGELAKSLDQGEDQLDASTQQPELPRKERVETSDVDVTESAVNPEAARSDDLLITTSVPVPNDKVIILERAEEHLDATIQPLIAEEATSLLELRIAEQVASTQPPEKDERKDDLPVEITSSAPLEAIVKEHEAPVITQTAEKDLLIIELITEQPIVNETLSKERRKRETVEILEEKELVPAASTSLPVSEDSNELKEKADEKTNLSAEDTKELDTKTQDVNLAPSNPIEEKIPDKTDAVLLDAPKEEKVLLEKARPLPEVDGTTISILD